MRLIIVSNRLPVTVESNKGKLAFKQSAGGLVQGLSASIETIMSLTGSKDYIWVGWPGATIKKDEQESIKNELLNSLNAYPVFLTEEEMEKFYLGFCNSTIWPLFHNISTFATYEESDFLEYKNVNEKFKKTILEIAQEEDIIWIHDYHLMILPKLLREGLPKSKIGFFLHIPFPSFETIKLIPKSWREDILSGLLGANLVGFHTFAYQQNFLRSIRRLLGLEHSLGKIFYQERSIKTGVYPIGIDFDKYNLSCENENVSKEISELKKSTGERKIILSIDRLDYSKGIVNRLKAFELFLEKFPEWHEKVSLVAVVVPSRIGVYKYQETKNTIDQIIGKINGKFGNIKWTPIIYQFKNLPFEQLSAVYNLGDAILVTPLADGMNLVSKEYVAAQKDYNGVLILSECAGAFEEMRDTIIVNPNDIEEIARAMKTALEMDLLQKEKINARIQNYLKKYDIKWWTEKFMSELIEQEEKLSKPKFLSKEILKKIIETFKTSQRKLFVLDYDGTLTPLVNDPKSAKPSKKLIEVLSKLSSDSSNNILIISGRDRKTLDNWFGQLRINLSAEHGVYLKEKGKRWALTIKLNTNWKDDIFDVLNLYADKLPGSFVEKKEYSIVLHYRNCDEALASSIIPEVFDVLSDITSNTEILVTNISKGIEVKSMYINKGLPVLHFLREPFDFVFAAGDDTVDEEIFDVLPEGACSIKVGDSETMAKYYVKGTDDLLLILDEFASLKKTFFDRLFRR